MTERRQTNSFSFVDKVGWTLFALLIVGVIATIRFHQVEISLDPEDGSVTAIESNWWGFQKIEHPLRWVTPTDDEPGGWMTKDANGKSYRYIVSDDAEPNAGE